MWETLDPDGRRVVLDERAWGHILEDHGELEVHRKRILEAIETPTLRMRGRAANEEWYLLEHAGPARWLQVVVHYVEGQARVTTAFGRSVPPWR